MSWSLFSCIDQVHVASVSCKEVGGETRRRDPGCLWTHANTKLRHRDIHWYLDFQMFLMRVWVLRLVDLRRQILSSYFLSHVHSSSLKQTGYRFSPTIPEEREGVTRSRFVSWFLFRYMSPSFRTCRFQISTGRRFGQWCGIVSGSQAIFRSNEISQKVMMTNMKGLYDAENGEKVFFLGKLGLN